MQTTLMSCDQRRKQSANGKLNPVDYGSSTRFLLNGFTSLELSLQSSFQLSLTVLVCYRSRGRI